jgi:cyclic pyranopterin phosphate synthase
VTDGFTHLDDQGRAKMVDVGSKEVTQREAIAEARISMSTEVRERLAAGMLPKGDAFAVARVAAIQGAKRTSDLVPLCHPLALDSVIADIEITDSGVLVRVTTRVTARTGVEMEAMTGAAIGAIAFYDMIKGLDRGAAIGPVRLIAKSGGKSGDWRRG